MTTHRGFSIALVELKGSRELYDQMMTTSVSVMTTHYMNALNAIWL
jgi:hypothetical protein